MFQIQDFTRKNKDVEHSKDLKILTDVELKILKQQMFEIYKDVASVCKKYNLTFMLCGGSALGAVRHKGFIPWDDDIDVLMPREDVEKLIDVFHKELSEKYILEAPQKKADYPRTITCIVKKNTKLLRLLDFSNIYPCGIGIEIVTLDKIPSNIIKRYFKGTLSNLLFFMAISSGLFENRNRKVKRFFSVSLGTRLYYLLRIKIIGGICSIWGFEKVVVWYNKVVQYKGDSKLLGIPTGRKHYFGEIFPADIFLPVTKGEFEGVEVNLPAKCDVYLKNLYGKNYMELPPEGEREIHPLLELVI